MKTLGIIGGMSPESTAVYYTQINRAINQHMGGNHSAPILLDSVPFHIITDCQKRSDWAQAGAILAQSAQRLQHAGAQAIVLATNTMHKVAPAIEDAIDIPFLSIFDAIAAKLKQNQQNIVGVLGTAFTMQDGFYANAFAMRGIQTIMPHAAQQSEIHRIIFEELCRGQILPTSREYYRRVIDDLAERGAQSVILGCTEIGLLLPDNDCAIPLLDSAVAHIEWAVDWLLERA